LALIVRGKLIQEATKFKLWSHLHLIENMPINVKLAMEAYNTVNSQSQIQVWGVLGHPAGFKSTRRFLTVFISINLLHYCILIQHIRSIAFY